MKITQAEMMIRGEFNNCPGGDVLLNHLYIYNLNEVALIKDTDKPYWKNNEATLVMAIDKNDAKAALALAKIATEYNADEFDWLPTEDKYVIRMWWD